MRRPTYAERSGGLHYRMRMQKLQSSESADRLNWGGQNHLKDSLVSGGMGEAAAWEVACKVTSIKEAKKLLIIEKKGN